MKPQYVLFFRAEESEILLKTIMPYLIAKKRHAILYLEAREIMNLYNNMGQDLEVTDVRDKRLEAIYWELRILNMKGKNGAEHVLEEISRLPSDPRLYTREMMEQDVGVAWGVIGERKHDVRLRISREWKARNRDRMHAYWRDWSKRGKSEIPATPNYASA